MSLPTITLNDRNEIPVIGFGTGTELFGKDAASYVDRALHAGFSHIDTAKVYGNEDSVGEAIRNSGLAREDLWVTTKYWGGNIQDEVQISLKKLGLKFVDLYLIHNPQAVENGDFEGTWDQFVEIKDAGLAKSIGVSNFDVDQLQRIVKTGKTKPSVNQIRFHPYNHASYKELLVYAAKHGIVIEAYGSLAPITSTPGGPVDDVLAKVAKRIGGTPAQVIFKWVHAKGAVVITTTSRETRLQEYHAVPDLPDLTEDEVAEIDAAGAKGPPTPINQRRVAAFAVFLVSVVFALLWLRGN
ncbi:Aldo/keto reductase [Gloeopeniophorella convolvens]|nr:Aldo/keto reductase [Gloeopeniophorella convolvens]